MIKKLCYFVLLLALPFFANAQKKLTGKVTGIDNYPLAGVTIAIKDTKTKTTTNDAGVFSLTVPENKKVVLIFSYVGYETQELSADNNTPLTVSLKQVTGNLND